MELGSSSSSSSTLAGLATSSCCVAELASSHLHCFFSSVIDPSNLSALHCPAAEVAWLLGQWGVSCGAGSTPLVLPCRLRPSLPAFLLPPIEHDFLTCRAVQVQFQGLAAVLCTAHPSASCGIHPASATGL